MNSAPLYIVDIIGEVVAAVDAALFATLNKHILYEYGRSIQIITILQNKNNGISAQTKGNKYPLVALFQDFPETHNTFYSVTVKFPKISIAALCQQTDLPAKRYDNNFKPLLYPIYEQFFIQLAKNKNVVGTGDPDAFPHIKWDRPGTQPATDDKKANFNDFVDAIEIQNLEVTFKKVTHCKPPLNQ